MKKINNKLLGNSIIFTGMTVIQKGIALLLLPIYTKILSPSEYGISNLITVVTAIYILIFSLAMDDTVARYHFIYRDDINKLKKVVGTLVITTVSVSLLGTGLLIVFKFIFITPFTKNVNFYPQVLLGLIPVATSAIYGIEQKILIIEEKAVHYSINSICYFLINTLLCILFVVKFRMGVTGLLLATGITYSLFFVYSIILLYPNMDFCFDINVAKEGLHYSLVLLPNRVASWGLTQLNGVILGDFISTAALAIFNIANNFSYVLNLLANSASLVLQPWIYKQLEKSGHEENITLMINVCSGLFCIIGLTLSFFIKDVIYLLVNERYYEAIKMGPILVLDSVYASYGSLYIYILYYFSDKAKYATLSTLSGMLVNIIGSLLLVSKLGIAGSAWACVLSDLTICIIKTHYACKTIKIKPTYYIDHILAIGTFIISIIVLKYGIGIRIIIFLILVYVILIIKSKDLRKLKLIYKN